MAPILPSRLTLTSPRSTSRSTTTPLIPINPHRPKIPPARHSVPSSRNNPRDRSSPSTASTSSAWRLKVARESLATSNVRSPAKSARSSTSPRPRSPASAADGKRWYDGQREHEPLRLGFRRQPQSPRQPQPLEAHRPGPDANREARLRHK